MEVNRKAIMTCAVLIFFIVICIIVISETIVTSDILLGIFTGLTVSIVTSLVYYFHEKATIINKIKVQIFDVYLDLSVIEQMTKSILSQVYYTPMLDTLNYRMIISISDITIHAIDKSSLKLYSPFLKYGKWYELVKKTDVFEDKLYTLKTCLNDIQKSVLNADLLQSEKYAFPFAFTQEKEIRLCDIRNTVNIQTAKVHEYENSLLCELDNLGIEIYGDNWEKKKIELTIRANNILQTR